MYDLALHLSSYLHWVCPSFFFSIKLNPSTRIIRKNFKTFRIRMLIYIFWILTFTFNLIDQNNYGKQLHHPVQKYGMSRRQEGDHSTHCRFHAHFLVKSPNHHLLRITSGHQLLSTSHFFIWCSCWFESTRYQFRFIA